MKRRVFMDSIEVKDYLYHYAISINLVYYTIVDRLNLEIKCGRDDLYHFDSSPVIIDNKYRLLLLKYKSHCKPWTDVNVSKEDIPNVQYIRLALLEILNLENDKVVLNEVIM